MDAFQDFLRSKITTIDPSELHPGNLLHQSAGIAWALRLGRALLGWRFGLGKTRAQIQIAQAVYRPGEPRLV